MAGAVVNAEIIADDGTVTQLVLLDDGRQGDEKANDGVFGAMANDFPPGSYRVRFHAQQGDLPLATWEQRVALVARPVLKVSTPDGRRPLGARALFDVIASWQMDDTTWTPPQGQMLAWLEGVAVSSAATVTLTSDSQGAWRGQLTAPQAGGTYTLTVEGAAWTKEGLAVQERLAVPLQVKTPFPWWGWLPIATGGLAVVSGLGLYRVWARQPLVQGSLHLVRGPSGHHLPSELDLDKLARRRLSLGPETGHVISLPGASEALKGHSLQLRGRRGSDGEVKTQLHVPVGADVRINDRAAAGNHLLRDGDLIDIGPYRLRYRNLRQRSVPWQASGSRHRRSMDAPPA